MSKRLHGYISPLSNGRGTNFSKNIIVPGWTTLALLRDRESAMLMPLVFGDCAVSQSLGFATTYLVLPRPRQAAGSSSLYTSWPFLTISFT